MFGRQPRLLVDLAFGLPASSPPKPHSQYVHDLKGRLEESYRVATENASKTANRNKLRFDKRVVDSTLEAGDRVLVRNVRIRGKHKLADKWESDIHIVVKHVGNLPVYTVQPQRKDGPRRTLHRDLLLPCRFLPVAESEELPKQAVNRRRTRRQCSLEVTDESEIPEDHSDLEDQDCYHYLPEQTTTTDLIETRVFTWSEPVPSKERQLKETSRNTGPPVDEHPAPVNLEGKKEYFITRQLEREKRHSSERGAAERCPVKLTPAGVEDSPALRHEICRAHSL